MPEATKLKSDQEESLIDIKRQEGDGNDCCNSENYPPASGSLMANTKGLPCPRNDRDQDQKPPYEGSSASETDQEITVADESESQQQALVPSAGDSKANSRQLVHSNTPRKGQLSSKELRQQLRQVQSQELIRRILQSTAEVQSLVLQEKAVNKSQKQEGNNSREIENVAVPTLSEKAQKKTGESVQVIQIPVFSPSQAQGVSDEASALQQETASLTGIAQVEGQKYMLQTAPVTLNSPADHLEVTSQKGGACIAEENSLPEKESEGQTLQGNIRNSEKQVSTAMQSLPTCNSSISGLSESVVNTECGEHLPRDICLPNEGLVNDGSLQPPNVAEDNKALGNPGGLPQELMNVTRKPLQLIEKEATSSTSHLTNVHQLSERLEESPTQETLKEILRLLQNQSQLPSVHVAHQGTANSEQSHSRMPSLQSSDVTWQQSVLQPFAMTTTDIR